MSFYLMILQDAASERNYTLFFPAVFIPVLIIAFAGHRVRRRKILNQAKTAYESSLSQLRSAPNDIELKRKTIELGTKYVNLNKNKFDEAALKKDIDSAVTNGQIR